MGHPFVFWWIDEEQAKAKTTAGPFDKLRAGSSTSLRMTGFKNERTSE
jgi:hypothetical protein